MKGVPVEICVDADVPSVAEDVSAAVRGGASRIELCTQMVHGGTTPIRPTILEAVAATEGRGLVVVMVRPRPGDFDYSVGEVDRMARSIDVAARCGASGVALGVVRAGALAEEVMERLVGHARERGLVVTCHRAFDAVEPGRRDGSLEVLEALGVVRVLTSGTPWESGQGAVAGLPGLTRTVARAAGRVEVVVAGGVSAANAGRLVGALGASGSPISIHAYSSVRREGRVSEASVRELVKAATPGLGA